MIPSLEENRSRVDQSAQANTVDVLSAVAALIRQVTAIGGCQSAYHTFDGVRLAGVSARSIGEERLAPNDRTSFSGRALRCELTRKMIGGFLPNEDNEASRRPKKASVWFARLAPGQPFLPVRVTFIGQGSPDGDLYLK